MEILCNLDQGSLEHLSPEQPVDWTTIASGYWSEDIYHSGHIEYRVAQAKPDQWILESVERNAALDDVTEEDVEAGLLNDDQLQAMWGMSLSEAQETQFRQIVIVCNAVPANLGRDRIVELMFEALKRAGGKMIEEEE